MSKIYQRIIPLVIAGILLLSASGCYEQHYYHEHHYHTMDYYQRNHIPPPPGVDINIHN
jgi:hypothetical protein